MGEYSRPYALGNRKVAIVGVGYVGSTIAYAMALRDVAREIVLIDRNEEKALGEARDIRHGIPSMGTSDVYPGTFADCSDCDMIVICAGRNRRPGESRLDLANENTEIMWGLVNEIKKHYTRGVILVISNPVDVLTYKADQWLGLPNGTVFGSGCILDCSRLVRSVADHVGLSTGVINGYVVGEHGDGQVPLWSRMTVGGIPLSEYCHEAHIPWDETIKECLTGATKTMGGEIIRAKGRTHFGIATCVCQIADAVINQRPMIACVSSTLLGEHGCRDVALSVPSVIGPVGVQQRIREKWEPEEYRSFFDAVETIRQMLKSLAL